MTLEDEEAPVRCALWTQEHEVDPVGTAGTYDTVVLVEWPLPWPRDVGDVETLAPFAARDRTRLLLVLPEVGHNPRVTVWKYSATEFQGHDYPFDRNHVAETITAALSDETAVGEPAPPEVLICGHGTRDRCCGSLGVRLLAACQGRLTGVRVRRCSHTGGHRFAPTALTFPSGRMWAYLDVDTLERIVNAEGNVEPLLRHYRGSIALAPDAQVAERAAFAHFGWAWLSQSVTASTSVGQQAGERQVQLSWTGPLGDGTASARVAHGRTLPVPTCGSPIHMSKKESTEPRLVAFDVNPTTRSTR